MTVRPVQDTPTPGPQRPDGEAPEHADVIDRLERELAATREALRSTVADLESSARRLAVRESQQAMIARLGARALAEPSLQRFLDDAVRDIQATMGTDLCKVLELQPGGDDLLLRSGVGWNPGLEGEALIPTRLNSQAGYTLASSEVVTVDDLESETRFNGPALLFDHGVVSGVSCVIRQNDDIYGVLGLHVRNARHFTPDESRVVETVAAIIGQAVVRHATRMRLAVEAGASRMLTESRSVEDFVTRLHAIAREELGTVVAALWTPTADGGLARTVSFAPSELDPDTLDPWLETVAAGGEGEQPLRAATWIAEPPPNGPQGGLRLRGGLSFPIMSGADFLGHVLLLSDQLIHADTALLRSLESIGRATGDYLRRLDAEQRFEMTFDGAPIGIGDRTLDGRWLRVNRRLSEITGYSEAEIVSGAWNDILEGTTLGGAGDEAGRSLSVGPIERTYIRKDGVQICAALSAKHVRQASSGPGLSVVVVEDITDRKAIEADLSRSEARFRKVLLHSPVPKMMFDDSGKVLALSDSWTEATGYDIADLPTVVEWQQLSFRNPSDGAEAFAAFWQNPPDHVMREREVITKSGIAKTFQFSVVRLNPSRSGEEVFLIAGRDVTQEREYELQLERESRQKDTFIAMLGHELRNPLAAVFNATALLRTMTDADARIARIGEILTRQVNHMAKLLDGLLDVSRLAHGKITLDRAAVDLSEVARNAVAEARSRVPARGDDIVMVGGSSVMVLGDENRLAQIAENLVTNAVRYSSSGERVQVSVAAEDGVAILTVADQGHGIAAESIPDLFVPFHQDEHASARSEGGLGLGLALVDMLVKLHGGQVEVHSEGAGQGSTFTVTLPLLATDTVSHGTHAAMAQNSRGVDVRTILVVDDNVDAATTTAALLELDGHTVHVAQNGREAVELSARVPFDAIFCDIGLPDGMDGFDVVREIRTLAHGASIKVIALTGYGSEQDAAECFHAGFDAHLKKPASLDDLRNAL